MNSTLKRYIDILILNLTAIIICIILYPALNKLSQLIINFLWVWHWLIPTFIVSYIIILFWFLLIKIGVFRFRDLFNPNITIRFPPIWIFAFVSAILYLIIINHFYSVPKFQMTSDEFKYLFVYLLLTFAIAVLLDALFSVKKNNISYIQSSNVEYNKLSSIIQNPELLIQWIQKESPILYPNKDLFGMSIFARRITKILRQSPLKTIGIVGSYGSGKSSLISLIKYYLENPMELSDFISSEEVDKLFEPQDIITCRISGWGLNKGSASEHILKIAIKELNKYVDCISLFCIPSYYYSAISNSGSTWTKIIGSILTATNDPVVMLQKLDEILKIIKMRLIIFLEDFDRNVEKEVFQKEIVILLDSLKDLNNISFVLAITRDEEIANILIRISEHIETIPVLPRREVIDLIKTFRNYCLTSFKDIISCISEEKEICV